MANVRGFDQPKQMHSSIKYLGFEEVWMVVVYCTKISLIKYFGGAHYVRVWGCRIALACACIKEYIFF